MPKTPRRHQEDLASLFSVAFSALNQELHQRLNELGFGDIRPMHGFLFQGLIPDGATAKTLVELLGISKQAVSQMLDYLEERGYVARKPHPSDGRGKLVVLTEKGQAAIKAKESIYSKIERRWGEIVGPERLNMMRSDLKMIIESINEGDLPQKLRPTW
ncbi:MULTISPECIES: MarR family winged helix-turn-helix transcriptional regulator [Paenibacillus]|jgi:DNA-binding MarR family transcriptional regulator|uniref:MarR family transcriptional regulator n=1 Tax=Paenibacillus azoreducens TaxID=116718 RepID=A0A919YHZ0_9BACL|nr:MULTISPECIES: MarR family transcriptional regulator [Paenibacillus]MBE9916309.1 MarR family transcriptional regulator [Paenibacillus donghaensis]GIO49943.1 MarR family transcriptional regulator [Paenibacillus azoreducens]